VDVEVHVGIRPLNLRHHAFEGHRLVRVVFRGKRVMSQSRSRGQHHAERNKQRDGSNAHVHPPHSHLPKVLPSANFAPTKFPACVPSRIGLTRMVTAVPGSNVDFRHPFRDNELGLPPSTLHSSLPPGLPALSTFT